MRICVNARVINDAFSKSQRPNFRSWLMIWRRLVASRRGRERLDMRVLIAGASFILVVVAMVLTSLVAAAPDRVSVVVNEEARRVDITIDGKPFTSYIW